MPYAEGTTISADQSKIEIERTLMKYGASEFVYGTGAINDKAVAIVGFKMHAKMIRFTLPLPFVDEFRSYITRGRYGKAIERKRSDGAASEAHMKEVRRRWRALALVIKAKLESVASGIVTFEMEFLGHFVLPNGKTVGDVTIPKLEEAYKGRELPSLLPGPTEDGGR